MESGEPVKPQKKAVVGKKEDLDAITKNQGDKTLSEIADIGLDTGDSNITHMRIERKDSADSGNKKSQ